MVENQELGTTEVHQLQGGVSVPSQKHTMSGRYNDKELWISQTE